MGRLLEVKNFDPPKNRLLMHSWTAHNYWIERYNACPYCVSSNNKSKIVDKNIIEENCK